MKKRNKIFIAILIFIVILILAVLLFIFLNPDVKIDKLINIKENINIVNNQDDIFSDIEDASKKTQKTLQEKRIIESDFYNNAVKEGNDSNCDKIEDEYFKNLCYQVIALSFLRPELCEKVASAGKDDCYFLINQKISIEKKDISFCDNLIKKDRCIESYKLAELMDFCLTEECAGDLKDSDNDGINDYEEFTRHKTDPLKSDTDGDGFSDGVEIKNGYDPLN